MGIPTSMTSGGAILRRAGYRVSCFPSDHTAWTEIQCSSSTAFASSRTRVRKFSPSGSNTVLATFEMPYSTKLYFARARQFKPGYSTSPWTTVASQRPYFLVDRMPDPGLYAHHVSQFGTLTTARSKTLRLTHAGAIPKNSTSPWVAFVASYKPNVTGVTLEFVMPFTLPQGVTITKVQVRTLRTAAGSTATYQFSRTFDNASGTLLLTLNVGSTSPTYKTITSSAMAEVVTSTRAYVLRGFIKTTSVTAGVGSEFVFADVTYTMPHLGASI